MATELPPVGDPGEDRYKPMAQINVTPMVDVMLVLLVIFMVTAPLLTVGVPLDLPKSSSAAVTWPKQPIVVSIKRDGATFIGDHAYDGDALRSQLASLAADDPSRVVYVRGDKTIAYGQLMDVLDTVSKAGFAKVSLLAEAANDTP